MDFGFFAPIAFLVVVGKKLLITTTTKSLAKQGVLAVKSTIDCMLVVQVVSSNIELKLVFYDAFETSVTYGVIAKDFAVVDYAEGAKRAGRLLRRLRLSQIHKLGGYAHFFGGFQNGVHVFD